MRILEIDFLKAFAAILVVLGHAISFYCKESQISIRIDVIQNLIYAVHVPLFFVIAGYLCKFPKNFDGGYYWKKIKRILIPFCFFATLKLIYSNLISAEYAHGNSFVDQLVSTFVVGDVYWFCYTMFILYLLAPILWKCSTYILNVILCTVVILNTVLFYTKVELTSVFQISNVVYYTFFFLFGICLSRVDFFQKIKILIQKRLFLFLNILIITILCLFKLIDRDMPVTNYILALALMVLLYCLAVILPKQGTVLKVCNIISRYSLQIMFLDSFNKIILFKIFQRFININILWVCIITVMNLFLSCVCCRVVERIPYIAECFGLERKRYGITSN